jgi:hypothetical protein
MRAAIFCGPHSIQVAERPDPVIGAPTDAVVREGHIQARGVDKDVVFIPAEDGINDQIDAAYRTR